MKSRTAFPDWDSLRFTLTIARAGGLSAAAQSLRLSQSTVFRRFNAIERNLGLRLFDRSAHPFRPTAAGSEILRAAELMEIDIDELHRRLAGQEKAIGGWLCVTATETLTFGLLAGYLARFLTDNPSIKIDLITENRYLSLPRREADIAFRPAKLADADLVGRRLSAVAWSLYAAPSYSERHGQPATLTALDGHSFVGWDDAIGDIESVRWMRAQGLEDKIVYRSNSLLHQLTAAKLGIGIAALPCFLADPDNGLHRLFPPLPPLLREIWVLTRRELSQARHVRLFLDFVGSEFAKDRPLLEGRQPHSAADRQRLPVQHE